MVDVGIACCKHLLRLSTGLQETSVRLEGLIQNIKGAYIAQKEFFDYVTEKIDVAQDFPLWEIVASVDKLTVDLLNTVAKSTSDMNSKMCEIELYYKDEEGTSHYDLKHIDELMTEIVGFHRSIISMLYSYVRNKDVRALYQFFSQMKSRTMQ